MKHLVIIGDQGVGKTLLGNWIDANTGHNQVVVYDESHDGDILKFAQMKDQGQVTNRTYVFITNDNVSYEYLSRKDFLIIKLVNIL